MKKRLIFLVSIILLCIVVMLVLNINVSINQGVNFQVSTIKLPLYLKILDFFDRHYNYNLLVKNIIKDAKTEEERVMKIFEWTCNNIRKVPKDFPVIDDHVLNIIIRGYGTSDQAADAFSTLCNYAAIDAFFTWIDSSDHNSRIPLSVIKLGKTWHFFDPYNGVYFMNKDNKFASIEEIGKGNWAVSMGTENRESNFNYSAYFTNLSLNIKKGLLKRSNIQSPLRRFIFEAKKWIRIL